MPANTWLWWWLCKDASRSRETIFHMSSASVSTGVTVTSLRVLSTPTPHLGHFSIPWTLLLGQNRCGEWAASATVSWPLRLPGGVTC